MFETLIIIAAFIAVVLGLGLWIGAKLTMALRISDAGSSAIDEAKKALAAIQRKNALRIIFVAVPMTAATWWATNWVWGFAVCESYPERCVANALPNAGGATFQLVIAVGVAVHAVADLLDNYKLIQQEAKGRIHDLTFVVQIWMILWMLTRAFGWTSP